MSRVAIRYSKALFELALQENKVDVVEKDLQTVKNVIESSVEFSSMLFNPLIQARLKSQMITKIFGGNLDTSTCNFLRLLCNKKRSDFLPEVIEKFENRVLDYKGILKGEVISASPMSEKQTEQIRQKMVEMTGKKVVLIQEIDKDLIGGFVVKVKDTVIDLSVKGQMEKLRERLVYG